MVLRQRRSERFAIVGTLALAALLSTAVETLQLFEPARTTSVSDLLCEYRGRAHWRDGCGGIHRELESGNTPAAGTEADGGASVVSAGVRRNPASGGGVGTVRFHAQRRLTGRQGSSAPGRSVAIRIGEGRGHRVRALRSVRPGCIALVAADGRAPFHDVGGGRRRCGGRRPRSQPVDRRVPDAGPRRCGGPCGRRRRRRRAFTTLAMEPLVDLLVRRCCGARRSWAP